MPLQSVYAYGIHLVWGRHVGLPLGTPMPRLSKCGGLLTGPVRWTQSVQAMWNDGIHRFVEAGPGNVLQGLIRKVAPEADLVSG